jgi:hypothetical protein
VIYHLEGTITVDDGPGCVWRGEYIPGHELVEIDGQMEGETAGRALWRVAQIVSFGWRYVRAYHVRAMDAEGHEEWLSR